MKIKRKVSTMSVQINTGKTTFTPEEQLELKRRLDKAESRAEKQAIFEAYKKEVGLVDQSSVEQTKAPVKPAAGTAVEKNSADKAQDKDKIVSQKSTTTIAFSDIIKGMTDAGFKLDEKSTAELGEALKKAGIGVDKEGNISIGSQEAGQKLNTVIANYAKGKQEAQIKFDQNTDQEFISRMVEDGAIKANQDGTYTVLDKAKAEGYLNKVEQPPQTVQEEPVELNLDATKETKTVKKESAVDVPEDLRHNKDARKQLKKDYEAILQDWVEDPENAETMKYSLAQDKYDKQIGKQMAKISKECKTKEEVLQKYYNEYASDEEKKFIDNMLTEAKKDEKGLLDAYNRAMGSDEQARIKSFDNDTRKNIAAYLKVCEGDNFNPDILLERMAVSDVMDNRSEKQIEKDKKYFIEKEAERQANRNEAVQNLANTRVHFSKDSRKQAQEAETNSAIEHNDIGDTGRKLVMECPAEFCDEVEAGKGDFEVNGKSYKFSEEKWKNFFLNASDSRHLDDETQENFSRDGNLTLKEGRKGVMRQTLITKDGTRRSFEEIIGNDNGKAGNRELNKYRDLAKTTGLSVDVNRTAAKRALHVLKNAGIGAALGFATGGLGSVAAGAVNIAGQTASQAVALTGQATFTGPATVSGDVTLTGPASLNYSQDVSLTGPASLEYHDSVVTTDYYTDQFGTTSVTHNTPVSGTTTGNVTLTGNVSGVAQGNVTLTGPASVTGDVSLTDDVTLKGEAAGQKYSDSGNTHLKTAGNAAALGAIGGALTGALTSGKVHAQGKSFDGTVNLTKEVEDTETEDTKFKLLIPQSKTVSVRSGQITDTTEVETRPAVRYRGPEAYTVLYQIDDADIPAKYKKAVYMKLDEMWREGTNNKFGDIPRNVPVYPAFTINVDGQEITVTRKDNWASVNINEGKPGTTGGIYDAKTKEEISYRGRGRITE